MKKILLIAAVVAVFLSCKKDERFVKFEQDEYTLHQGEQIDLQLSSSEPTTLFRYYVNDHNVIKVSSEGTVTGLYVGEATVVAQYAGLSATSNIIVAPQERLYSMIPLATKGASRQVIKILEQAINRDTIPAPMDKLVVEPRLGDKGLETLTYSFENDSLTLITAQLKTEVSESSINQFLKERYPKVDETTYHDFQTGAIIRRDTQESNKITYSWK